MATAGTVARALEAVATADSRTLEKSLDAALMAVAEATATTCDVLSDGTDARYRPPIQQEESASAATHSMQASAVGGQRTQPLLLGNDEVYGSCWLKSPLSSPRSQAVTAGVAAEDTIGMIATLLSPAVLPTADKLTAMHRAVAMLEQLIHTLEDVRPCAGGQVSQAQGRHLPACLSTLQDLQQQLLVLHGCRQELQHAIERSQVLGAISHADGASARRPTSNTDSALPLATATGGAQEPQLDALQHYRCRIGSTKSNSNTQAAPRQKYSSQTSHGRQAVSFGNLMLQQQAASAATTVLMPAHNRVTQVVSGVSKVVNSSSGNPLHVTAQQLSIQVCYWTQSAAASRQKQQQFMSVKCVLGRCFKLAIK